jgi:hypothetical protein
MVDLIGHAIAEADGSDFQAIRSDIDGWRWRP